MADTPTLEIPKLADGQIDFAKWEKDRPLREAARASQAAVPAKTAEETKPAAKTEATEEPRVVVPKSVRRELNQAKAKAAYLEGRLSAYSDLGRMPKDGEEASKPTETAKELERKDFKTDEEFQRALATRAAETAVGQTRAEDAQFQELIATIETANEKEKEDRKLFEDWDAVQAKLADDEDYTEINLVEEHPILFGAITGSKVRAGLVYYLATHPKDYKEILAMTPENLKPNPKDPRAMKQFEREAQEQAHAINMLEGAAKVLYYDKQKKTDPEKKEAKPDGKHVQTAAEADAKLPKPSESIAPKAGVATDGKVSMYMPDGKTVNPVYMAEYEAQKYKRR